MSQGPLDFINLFVQPPGDLLYFLVVVALSQSAFFMALGQRLRRPNDQGARRYTLATLGVVVAWAFMLVGALFALLSAQSADAILPPLERAANVVTILLVGWAFLTADSDRWGRTPNLILLLLIAVVIMGYVITGVDWPGQAAAIDFNASSHGVAWTFVASALSLLGAGLMVVYFPQVVDAPLKLLFFVVLLLGYGGTLLQMTQGTLGGDYAGLSRLGFIGALPILAAIIYRLVITNLESEIRAKDGALRQPFETPGAGAADPLQDVQVPSVASERESVQLMRALGLILEGATPSNIPQRIINATLQVLQADIGVLLVVQDANYADILAAYDRVMGREISGLSVNLESQPTLQNAIERRAQRPLYTDRNFDELRDLYTRLDIEQIGPTYFQPLVHERQLLAVLVVGMPYAGRELDTWNQELLTGIGIIAANLLALSRAADDARLRAEERIIQAMVQGVPPEQLADDNVMSAWQTMQANLDIAREQIAELNRQVTSLKVELDYERGRVTGVLSDTEEGLSISQRIVTLSEEQQRLIEERDRLAMRLREAETALAGATSPDNEGVFKTMIEILHREKDELAAQRDSLEMQLAELRNSGDAPVPHVVRDMLERMSAEKARLELERNQISGKLTDLEVQLKALGIEDGAAGLAPLVSQLYEQRASLQAKAEQLQRERDALLSERSRYEESMQAAEARDKQIQTLQTELKNVAADRESAIKQRDKLRGERDELLAKLESLKQQRARMTAEVAAFEQELAEAHDEQSLLRVQIQQLSDQRSKLIGQRDQLLAERQQLVMERDQLLAGSDDDRQLAGDEGIGALRRMIDDLSTQRDALEGELVETRNRLAEVENQLQAAERRALPELQPIKIDNPELFVGLTQELRTPMTSILGYVDLLLSESAGILGEMQRKFLQRVSVNVNRLGSMLEDLIRVTVIDTGHFSLSPQPVDVVGVIEDAITNASISLREKDLTVHLDLDDDVPPIPADPDAINQIIGQLLTNAYLVTPPGSEIFVRARQQPMRIQQGSNGDAEVDCLFVSIEDRGGGIAPEDQPRVFSRKYKAENPLIQGLGDTGVGLSIAKALVEAHGGQIWLETQENVGSVFSFALPLNRAAVAETVQG